MKRILALVAVAVALGVAGALAQSGSTATVEVRVWQRISDAQALYISARPEGGSWRTLGTIPIAMTGVSDSRAYRYGDITVRVPRRGEDATVEVRVWQRVRDDLRLYISARPRGGSWSTLGTIPLDMSGRSSTGTYRYGDISVDVPLPATPTPSPEPTAKPTPTPTPRPTPVATATPRPTPTPSGHTFTCSQLWDVHQSTPGPDEDTARTTVGYKVWDALCDSRNSQRLICADFRYQAARYSPRPTAAGAHLYARWNERMLAKLGCSLTGAGDTPPPSYVAPAPGCDFSESARSVVASTVLITTDGWTGSAFYVGNGEFVTAGHVVEGLYSVTISNAHISTTAQVIGYFDNGDVGLLRARGVSLSPLEWGDSPSAGDTVAAVGYPQFQHTNASVTRGIVSRMLRRDGISLIQTDAPVNPGNSGGPLVDECGRVVGVVTSKYADSEGLGFATADPSLRRLLSDIRAGRGQSPRYVDPRPTTVPTATPTRRYLTISSFCTRWEWEPRLDDAACSIRSRFSSKSHDYWQIEHYGSIGDNIVYRFNERGTHYQKDNLWDGLGALSSGCHDLEIAEHGISTHWSPLYRFCIR